MAAYRERQTTPCHTWLAAASHNSIVQEEKENLRGEKFKSLNLKSLTEKIVKPNLMSKGCSSFVAPTPLVSHLQGEVT